MPPKFTPNQPQAGRYWPGKPIAEDVESSDEYSEDEEEEEQQVQEPPKKSEPTKLVPAAAKPVPSAAKLVTTMKSASISEQGPYLPPEESSEEESDSEEEQVPEKKASRIRQARKRAMGDFIAADQVDLEEVCLVSRYHSYQETSEESSEEEEESSEEDTFPRRPLIRPTFVPKSQRDKPNTNGSSIGLAAYAAVQEDDPSAKIEKSKEQAIKFVENEIRNAAQAAYEAQMNSDANKGMEAVDDTDDLDPAAERAAWKLRELQRIKREREKLIARELEREELEKRRNMEESERLKEDYARVRELEDEREQNRGKMDFMQKYYHKGAFYQDEEILQRNYNVATAEEHKHKEALPQALQIRTGELGRASRTKWTHLTAEDTSKMDSPWFDKTNTVNKRTLGKMGGMHDPNDRERKRRKS